jgi:hypothetical protein
MKKQKSSTPKKKKTRVLRVAQHLPRDPRALYTHLAASWDAVKNDPAHYPAPYPPASEVDADFDALRDALKAAEGGDPVAVAALQVAVVKSKQTYELLSKYVQRVLRAGPIEDMPALLSAVLMYESNVGARPPKPELEAKQGPMSGIVLLIALAVPSAVTYFWEYSVDQVTWSAIHPTAQAKTTLAALTPGKVYYFRFHAFTRDNVMTDLSQVVSFMVT